MSSIPAKHRISCKASVAWNLLNSVFVIYKPALTHYLTVRETIIKNLCRGKYNRNKRIKL